MRKNNKIIEELAEKYRDEFWTYQELLTIFKEIDEKKNQQIKEKIEELKGEIDKMFESFKCLWYETDDAERAMLRWDITLFVQKDILEKIDKAFEDVLEGGKDEKDSNI